MAVNVRLIGSYLSDLATATATSTAAGYDAANVVPLDRNSLWVAGGTGAISLTLDLGSAKSITAVGIANHNGTGWSGAVLEASSNNFGSTPFSASLTGLTTDEDYYQTFASQSYQYWRIRTTSASAAMRVGIFYLGTATTLTANPYIGMPNPDRYNVERAVAQSGAIVAEKWGRRLLKVAMHWDVEPTATYTQLRDFIRTEDGPLRPFWYVPREDSSSPTYGRAYLVRCLEDEPPAQEIYGGLWSFSVTLLEEV